jgi:hypothetical protein
MTPPVSTHFESAAKSIPGEGRNGSSASDAAQELPADFDTLIAIPTLAPFAGGGSIEDSTGLRPITKELS